MNQNLIPMDIYIAEIPFEEQTGSKYRPALVMQLTQQQALVYKITSQHNDKSARIQSVYFPISEWEEAGLKKQSFVDVHKLFPIQTSILTQRRPIGRLTDKDAIDLYGFIVVHEKGIQEINVSKLQKEQENLNEVRNTRNSSV